MLIKIIRASKAWIFLNRKSRNLMGHIKKRCKLITRTQSVFGKYLAVYASISKIRFMFDISACQKSNLRLNVESVSLFSADASSKTEFMPVL